MRLVLLLCCALALAAAPAAAAPSYSVALWNGNYYMGAINSTSPINVDTAYVLAPSNGSGSFHGIASVGPGYANATGRVECVWGGGFSGAFSGRIDATATAYDCIISGPPSPPVHGTLNLGVHVDLSRTGGYPGNNGHGAYFQLNASTLYSGARADLFSGNYSTYGSYAFAGITSPSVDTVLPLTGNYPVNQSFSLNVSMYSGGATYGNSTYNDGMVEADAGNWPRWGGTGVRLEMVNGQVMTLPAGYTFSIPSWGITGNTVAVGDPAPGPAIEFRLASANPAAGDTRVALALPRDGDARVDVHDITGRLVRTVFEGRLAAGQREFVWDGRDAADATVPAGLYFIGARVDGRVYAVRVTRVR